ncbi:hypothetical protein AVEN_193793-1 [Araneus ventricosus]|uniref:Uncharacterized protein n=1 Tax=Araneus ventricosus TaxID=182803 RepID=A0A4Y2DNT5_ARAVE|nr:hypothetical protein AVEN_193793-1 [Araneus ventricosus]
MLVGLPDSKCGGNNSVHSSLSTLHDVAYSCLSSKIDKSSHYKYSVSVKSWCSYERLLWRTETKRKVETCTTLDSIPKRVCSATVRERRRCHLSRDGAPLHYGDIVREFLDTTFPQRWIGRGAVMAWPPRSPDITPLDFYLWDYVKQHEYSERINDINHLKQRITDVIHSVTPDVFTRVWEELDYRLDV